MIIILHASLGGRVSAADIATPPKVSGVMPQTNSTPIPPNNGWFGIRLWNLWLY